MLKNQTKNTVLTKVTIMTPKMTNYANFKPLTYNFFKTKFLFSMEELFN